MGWKRNKVTGEVVFVPDSGAPQPWIGKPTAPLEVPQMQGQIENTAANAARTRQSMAIDQREIALKERNANLEAQVKAAQLAEEQRKAAAADPYNAQQLSSSAGDAMNKLEAISRIGNAYQDSNMPVVGFGAETLSGIGGTGAASVQADLDSLKAGGALTEVLKMSQATGKNPFTPMSNSDVELIARNIGNLSQRPDGKTFFSNLGNYKQAYTNAYVGSRGAQALNEATKGLPPQQRKKAQELYQRDPRASGVSGELLPRPLAREINARVAEYRQQNPDASPAQLAAYRKYMSEKALPNYRERQKNRRAGVAAAPRNNDYEFLGFED